MGDTEEIELFDGNVKLYRRNGKNYYVRMYEGNRKYKVISLKTTDARKAEALATQQYTKLLGRLEAGLPTKKRTFNAVIDQYVKERQESYESHKNTPINTKVRGATSAYMLKQITRVVKFWRDYCGNTAIESIDNERMRGYVKWRKDYYKDKPDRHHNTKLNPADKTIQWEFTLGKSIIKWAEDRGYRGSARSITEVYNIEKKIVRAAFTLEEYRLLIKALQKNIKEKKKANARAETIYTAELLKDYVLILSNTGMRVGEANALKESDVELFYDGLKRKNYKFYVKGKTGIREVVGRVNVVRYIDRVLKRNDIRKQEEKQSIVRVSKAPKRKNPEKDDWLFSMWDGNKIITLIDQFDAVLKQYNLDKNRYGQKFSLYSLRHFYASQSVRRDPRNLWDLEKNMGTSIEQIRNYYGKYAPTDEAATRLGGEYRTTK